MNPWTGILNSAPAHTQGDASRMLVLHGLRAGDPCPHCGDPVPGGYRSACPHCTREHPVRCCGYSVRQPTGLSEHVSCRGNALVPPPQWQCSDCSALECAPDRARRVVESLSGSGILEAAEDYQVRPGRARAEAAGKRWLEAIAAKERQRSTLCIYGETRGGKTVLACRLTRAAIINGHVLRAMWTTEDELVRAARNPTQDESWELLRKATQAPLLVVDEMWRKGIGPYVDKAGREMNSARSVSDVFHQRWGKGLPTIITSNYANMADALARAFDSEPLVARWEEVGAIEEVTR